MSDTTKNSNEQTYWRTNVQMPEFAPLSSSIEVDVAVIGGGITGLTTAYLLTEQGKKVALLEADRVCEGTTGHTTAKITAQHGFIYDELISHLGKSGANIYYQANQRALAFIRELVSTQEIECDFEDEHAYLYATTDQGVAKLKKEKEAYEQLGIPHEWLDSLPINISVKAALCMKNQAQFHPLKFMAFLANEIVKKGGLIFEQTVALDINHDAKPTVLTKNGYPVTASSIVAASHFPFVDKGGLYFSRMKADRSYIVAAETNDNWPGGMYLSVDKPSRSIRASTSEGNTTILLGGEHHKAGQGGDTRSYYEALETYGNEHFDSFNITHQWSAQDLTTLDNLPYIGRLSPLHTDLFVATGYRKWGMTGGTNAAMILANVIIHGSDEFESVFLPSRVHADPSIRHFLKENVNVASELIKGKISPDEQSIDSLEKDEGAAVHFEGKKAGAYRNSDGEIFIVDTTCTHIGCEVGWNKGDRTWDCPCHGSRFSYSGEVLEGPAKKPLPLLSNKKVTN
ncbi:FAD-dependent oxidoreductase [Alkalicoccobacillus murimartini]|uniref:Glycine/D-amino acid oxidase-like deaminating enzyme/nitrite reductase/ring-hydroxylating ferredoxin subunit n=1 Tax=Alkalicoccobacillus murimartini TaxID=171685 RepID=A0ABT9YHF6_9BACI|nr:FAD-dependent oxidoreductase [Alkalicoccobacillus murimartini]MDQ0207131.1 glycine/D-amino acid oxidase-like deaminating enzyme/nitrite reductase/ring-hydroxylating ferredoxin subunit [Alkalicoccobacillus murimartini]